MPALTMKETSKPSGTPTEKKIEQQIRRRAYELYEARGRGNGHEIDDWLQAETDITRSGTSDAAV